MQRLEAIAFAKEQAIAFAKRQASVHGGPARVADAGAAGQGEQAAGDSKAKTLPDKRGAAEMDSPATQTTAGGEATGKADRM